MWMFKKKHKNDHYYWAKKPINKKINNVQQIKEEKEKETYLEEINQKKIDKSNIEKQINELNYNKNILMKEQNEIKEKINNKNNQIAYIIIKLKKILQKIEDITMNRSHLKSIDEYIDSLKDKMEKIGLKDEEQKKELKRMKENIKDFKEVNRLKEDEMINLNDSQFAEKLGIIIPKLKNSN